MQSPPKEFWFNDGVNLGDNNFTANINQGCLIIQRGHTGSMKAVGLGQCLEIRKPT